MDILIPKEQLTVDDKLLKLLAERVPVVRWHELDEDLRSTYARQVALLDGELRQELGACDLSEAVSFYNAYYWALVFAKQHQARYGFDAGVQQEAFKLLECAPADVDWQAVEYVARLALQAFDVLVAGARALLSEEDMAVLLTHSKEDAIQRLHFTAGHALRSALGLWEDNATTKFRLIESHANRGVNLGFDADGASSALLGYLWDQMTVSSDADCSDIPHRLR
ncbi:MAG TPA: hypothetical protein VF491_12370 [Vicinamibacterales bacterium]